MEKMAKDVMVLGGGVGGLSAAIYSRLAGHNVCLLEASDKVGGKAAGIDIQGYRLDPGPSIIILTRIYEQLFRDAGRKMEDYLTFQRLDPISRVYFGQDEPIDLPANREECERLVDHISPSDGKNFRDVMGKLDKVSPHIDRSIFARPFDAGFQLVNLDLLSMARYFNVQASYKQLVDGWFQSPLLRAFFYGFPSYGGQSYESKAPGALLIPYLMIQEGVYYPRGGVSAIPKALERLAIELGVEIRTGCNVTGLQSNGKSLTEVDLSDGSKLKADAFISGIDRLTTRAWLGEVPDVQPSYSYFTLHWGIRRRIEGLKHHTLLVPKDFEKGFERLYKDRRFPNPPIVYLNETTELEPAAAPKGCSNLFAVVTSPSIEKGFDWQQESAACRREVVGVLDEAGFKFEPEEIEFERMQNPLYFSQAHGNYKGSLYGPDEAHRLFGMLPLRNYDEKYRNLFYCGGSVQPGAGLPMVILSGKFAAGKL